MYIMYKVGAGAMLLHVQIHFVTLYPSLRTCEMPWWGVLQRPTACYRLLWLGVAVVSITSPASSRKRIKDALTFAHRSCQSCCKVFALSTERARPSERCTDLLVCQGVLVYITRPERALTWELDSRLLCNTVTKCSGRSQLRGFCR